MADTAARINPDKEYDTIVFGDSDVAEAVAQMVREDVTVLSTDELNDTKLHLHDNETGGILTQINIGAQEDWDSVIDLR